MFGGSIFPTCDKPAVFTRPVFAAIPSVPGPEVCAPCKKLRTSVFANHWKQVVTTVDVASWSESQEAKLDTAIKRCHDLVLRFPYGIAIKDQISLRADVSDQLRVLRDVFATKSPLTLIKRATRCRGMSITLIAKGCFFQVMKRHSTVISVLKDRLGAHPVDCNL